MAVDDRPLPADWKALMSRPPGAVICRATDPGQVSKYSRHYEFSDMDAVDALKIWRAHLSAEAWKVRDVQLATGGACLHELTATKRGAKIKLTVSQCVEGKGWSTVAFRTRSKITCASCARSIPPDFVAHRLFTNSKRPLRSASGGRLERNLAQFVSDRVLAPAKP